MQGSRAARTQCDPCMLALFTLLADTEVTNHYFGRYLGVYRIFLIPARRGCAAMLYSSTTYLYYHVIADVSGTT